MAESSDIWLSIFKSSSDCACIVDVSSQEFIAVRFLGDQQIQTFPSYYDCIEVRPQDKLDQANVVMRLTANEGNWQIDSRYEHEAGASSFPLFLAGHALLGEPPLSGKESQSIVFRDYETLPHDAPLFHLLDRGTCMLHDYPFYETSSLKNHLQQLMCDDQRIGRGYAVPLSDAFSWESYEFMIFQYNSFAWGGLGAARHRSLSADECDLIQKLSPCESLLEVGCGNGRLSAFLQSFCSHLTLTDLFPVPPRQLQSLTKATYMQDTIVNSQLPSGHFDRIFFLENGLGSILNPDSRKSAYQHMARVLKPQGEIIVGIRSLEVSPIAHLMPAPHDSRIMGLYWTFSVESLLHETAPYWTLIQITHGHERPAGGSQTYLHFRKKDA